MADILLEDISNSTAAEREQTKKRIDFKVFTNQSNSANEGDERLLEEEFRVVASLER
uniref:Uncharacterized protein n=1 Tax=Setaria digitata TaxID=48799 RepID=A0A915PT45_9BILA